MNSFYATPNPLLKTLRHTLLALLLLTAMVPGALAQDPAAAPAPQGTQDAAQAAASGTGDAVAGATIWSANCTTCHKINEALVGPALRGANSRWPNKANLHAWIRNSQKYLKEHPEDQYAQNLYKEYNQSIMTAFDLSDAEIDNVLAYIDAEGAKPAVATGPGVVDGAGTQQGNSPAFYTQFDTTTWLLIVGALALAMLALLFMGNAQMKRYRSRVQAGDIDPYQERTFLSRLNPRLVTLSVALVLMGGAGAYATQQMLNTGIAQGYQPTQPIAFSHKLHAGQYNIQCSYCHIGVERWKSATIPATNICMNCHNVIKKESPEIQKIYAARESGQPIQWVRIHNLQDFVYFNHYQHYKLAGIKCQQCHGNIQNMEVVAQSSTLTMGWCIDCHRKTNVDLTNGYYQTVHTDLASKHKKQGMTIAQMGGLECSKCHY